MLAARLAAALLASALVLGCSPGDDGDTVVTVMELEPNDDQATATPIGAGGFYSFFGVCDDGESADWFQLTSKEGHLQGDLWASTSIPGVEDGFAPGEQIAIAVLSSTLEKLDEQVVENDRTRTFSADVSAGIVYLQLVCPGMKMAFQGTVHVP